MRITTAFCFVAFSTNLWAADPFLGTWKLNPTKSKFEPGPAPRSLTVNWANDSDGIKVRSEGVRADGRPMQESYGAIYDGKERKKPGPWNFDSVINRQLSENEREDIFKKDGVIVGTSRLVLSADGKILITTWSYRELRDVRVFDKQ
jgi:hypothetical protein